MYSYDTPAKFSNTCYFPGVFRVPYERISELVVTSTYSPTTGMGAGGETGGVRRGRETAVDESRKETADRVVRNQADYK